MKNPRTKFILFTIASLMEIVFVIIISRRKNIDYSSFDDWLSSQLFLTSTLILSFSLQAWKAYQEMKKMKNHEIE